MEACARPRGVGWPARRRVLSRQLHAARATTVEKRSGDRPRPNRPVGTPHRSVARSADALRRIFTLAPAVLPRRVLPKARPSHRLRRGLPGSLVAVLIAD